MPKHKSIKTIFFAILIQLVLFTGCTRNNTNANQNNPKNNQQQVGNTVLDNEAINMYSLFTKNTSRILGTTSEGISLSTSCIIWPASEIGNRPKVVLIAPSESWQIQLVATDLIHHPSDGPLLITSKDKISDAVLGELSRLNPIGDSNGTKIITVGISDSAAKQLTDKGYKIHQIKGDNAYKLAEDIDSYYASVAGELPNSVIISSSEQVEYTIPAANWIAHMPEPLLYVTKDNIPSETESALGKRNGKANIYVLGPESVISKSIEVTLKKYGKVTRISGDNPYSNAIAFSKFKDKNTGFGWGITMPGHGLLLVSSSQAKESIATASFSHRGKHAPLLLTDNNKAPQELLEYLKQLKPYFEKDPTEGPYNHIYITGNNQWITQEQQGNLDHLIEIEAATVESPGGTNSNKMTH